MIRIQQNNCISLYIAHTSYNRKIYYIMKKASPVTFLQVRKRAAQKQEMLPQKQEEQRLDLNIFVVTFNGMKEAESNISGGDPYTCIKCKAILNKFSTVVSAKQLTEKQNKFHLELKNNQSLWQCQFCGYPNVIKIDKQEIPTKDDVVYLVQSQLQNIVSENDSTMVFCIDSSGSMNTTTQIQGKVDLKFGLSQQQIQMLKQFMEPGDQAQFNSFPGQKNKNKTFISRKQCILSAIESQLKQIKKLDPHKKVGFVTFNNEVTVIGDNKNPTVNILGDKLNNRQSIVDTLTAFKLNESLQSSYQSLINQLAKQQAKGQTALGPALVSALEIASKGSPGSTVILCTDGLANIGIGLLDPLTEENKKFYEDLANLAKQKNIAVNIMTIKGQGCKMEVIGKLAQLTNGNMKVVNPEKLSDDFANVLKDQVVGLNVQVIIQLHRAMNFRNQQKENLFQNGTILKRKFANATSNTKVSFEYELRCQQDLKFMEIDVNQLKKVPFQTQILYTSPRGGKFVRVVSSQSNTTTDKKQMMKDANIGVAHQRVTALTANMYSRGQQKQSMKTNKLWSNYLMDNFQQQKYQKKQMAFQQQNVRLNKAMQHKSKKAEKLSKPKKAEKQQKILQEQMNRSQDSDEDHQQLMDNLMEKQNYDLD